MRTLTNQEVNSSIKTVYTEDAGNGLTYYIDELQSGQYGLSIADRPLGKFFGIAAAKEHIKKRKRLATMN